MRWQFLQFMGLGNFFQNWQKTGKFKYASKGVVLPKLWCGKEE